MQDVPSSNSARAAGAEPRHGRGRGIEHPPQPASDPRIRKGGSGAV